MSSLQRAAVIQGRVIGALVLRDLLAEYGRSRISFAWAVLRPAFILLLLYSVGLIIRRLTPQGMPLLVFLTTGYLTWFTFIRTLAEMPSAVDGSRQLLMFPHLTPLDLLVSRCCVDLATYTATFVLFVGVGLLFERASLPENPLGVAYGFWCAALIGCTLGVIAAVASRFTDIVNMLLLPVRRLGILVSGVFFVAASLPSWLLPYVSWSPLLHAMEIIRESWWPAYRSPIADPAYLAKCVFFLLAAALLLERTTRRWDNP